MVAPGCKYKTCWVLTPEKKPWTLSATMLENTNYRGLRGGKMTNRAERAYNMRKRTRMTWQKIFPCFGYRSHSACMYDVQRYAIKNKKPWPLPKALTQGEVAYEEYQECGDWDEVRRCINKSTIHRARMMAYHYAKENNKPWPPPLTQSTIPPNS